MWSGPWSGLPERGLYKWKRLWKRDIRHCWEFWRARRWFRARSRRNPRRSGSTRWWWWASGRPRSVLLGNDLRLLQADKLSDLSGALPGFNVVTSDTRGYGDVISMRGSAETPCFSSPSVGMMVDDVPQGEVFGYPAGLLDLAQVRLLRGPQGAAFGRNKNGRHDRDDHPRCRRRLPRHAVDGRRFLRFVWRAVEHGSRWAAGFPILSRSITRSATAISTIPRWDARSTTAL